jgi:hypothetical protein
MQVNKPLAGTAPSGVQRSASMRAAIVLASAIAGWAYCGALIGISRQFWSMDTTLVVHAIGAPIGFALLSFLYYRFFAFTSPLATAAIFIAVVFALDFFLVALLIEKSFAMFASPLGTWLPLALIFAATLVTGLLTRPAAPRSPAPCN